MTKKVKIYGLDCPNCARTLEGELNKLDSVRELKIDFVKSTISFECQNEEIALNDIIAQTKKLEPQAKIVDNKDNKHSNRLWLDIAMLAIGLCIGIVALTVPMPIAAFWTLFVLSVLFMGYKTYIKAFLLLIKGKINENLLITISVIGAAVIDKKMEAIMVIALYSLGKILEGIALDRSRKSIEKLTAFKPDYAVLIDGEQETRVDPSQVRPGQVIIVRPGEKVALDGVIIEGNSTLDTQSLTGESMPLSVKKNDSVLSGSIVLDGVIKIKTTSNFADSTASKIMDLIENATEKKSKTETFISKITKWYTLGVIVCAIIVWGIVWAVKQDLDLAVYRGLIFLVTSCPCAFAISVPLAYFSGLGTASKHGILIKGSNYLDACAKIQMVAFDKTGTLTTGKFAIKNIVVFDKDYSKKDIIYLASIGEQYSLHPLAKSIVKANKKKLKSAENVEEKSGEGVYYDFEGEHYFVGRKTENIRNTIVELYKNDKKLAEIDLEDTIKPTSLEACKNLKALGIKTVLLSGDNDEVVKKVAGEVGVQEAYGKLLPQDKYAWIEQRKNERIGYVGDGLNDAPSLALADVGFSMGINGNSASIEAADIVLVDDDPNKIERAIKLSRFTRRIVWENISLSAIIKFTFLLLGSLGVTGILSAVIADVGVTLLAILNSLRILRK